MAPTNDPRARSGRDGFISWLLGLDARTFIVPPTGGTVTTSPSLTPLLASQGGGPELLASLVGQDGLVPESFRRAVVSIGPREGAGVRRLWALIPVESDGGDVLLVGLLIGLGDGETPQTQEAAFTAAMQEPDRRHGINQPLTALSFLLENLLHAFETSSPAPDYSSRKAGDLGQQLRHLRDLLRVTRVDA